MSIDRLLSAAKAASLCFATVAFLPANGAASPGPSGVSVAPAALVFGNQMIGAVSVAQAVAITNSKNNSLSISSIALSGDYKQTNTCGSSLPSGATCTIAITFVPTAAGARTGTLTITDNGPKSPQSVSLSGTGIGIPMAALSTLSLKFGDQNIGTSSPAQTFTLSNTGSAPLSLSSIGATGDFSQTNNCGSSLAAGSSCQITATFTPTLAGTRTGTLTITDNALGSPHTVALTGMGIAPAPTNGSNITAIWANEGGDKVTQDELRASEHVENLTGTVLNRAWNGSRVSLFGAHNEVVSFNLVLEAAGMAASNVTIKFDTLTGPGGATITSQPATGDGVFNWVGRPIELFFVRYLQIKGLSFFGYEKGDERQIPIRFQTPWTGNGYGTGVWTDRPDHDKFYPDIMVPLELVNTFNIVGGQNQSVWADIYIPKTVPSGTYTGNVVVQENGVITHTVPVQLLVENFNLPDTPTAKTMAFVDTADISWRYVSGYGGYTNYQTAGGLTIQQVTDKYYELLHRHKLAAIGEDECPNSDSPCASSIPRLDGSLFTAANGYDGPGVNTPNGVFSIGTYGTWGLGSADVPNWRYDQSLFWQHIDNWVSWFDANLPTTDYFLYLQDEPPPSDYPQLETWAEWIAQDPGPGQRLHSMATVNAVIAQESIPSLDLPTTASGVGWCPYGIPPCDNTTVMQNAVDFYNTTPQHQFWQYNASRPGVGSDDTEDDGVAMRTIPWSQYKKNVGRWFYWDTNITNPIDFFQSAVTFGSISYTDPSLGQYGTNGTTNGNGVLLYPGTDLGNPSDSYGVHGPFASLRLKEWRRGVQDTDYLALAQQIDPASTQAIVSQVMPQALWEYNAPDPSWYSGTISWSNNPDDWEASRSQLAQIISGYCAANPGATSCASN
jgi:hypothetical protein